MTLIRRVRPWEIPQGRVTPESLYRTRRQVLRDLGVAGLMLGAPSCYLSVEDTHIPSQPTSDTGADVGGDGEGTGEELYPADRNETYQVPERGLTPEEIATRYNNFYEITTAKDRVWELVTRFQTTPWTIDVSGLCNNPQTFDLDDLIRLVGLEERVYRFRCVEAWSMTVPWTGFPLSALLDLVEPLSSATHLRMQSANRPTQMPGIDARPGYPWPYREGLRIDEAYNEMTFMATGLYGAALPGQNGAPFRLVVPWKYGYKSIKSVIRIELTDSQPATFWNDIAPNEYGFLSNVDPAVSHPRWSQAHERLIDDGSIIDTQLYNGYAEQVSSLYPVPSTDPSQ